MNLEQPQSPELNAVEMTGEEYVRLQGINPNNPDPELLKLMEQKGIAFDSGDIVISRDGRTIMMCTDRNDFGTILAPETVEKRYGKEKKESLDQWMNNL